MENDFKKDQMEATVGLTSTEASKKLQRTGRNELIRESELNPIKILISQFTSPLILILVAAAAISIAVGFFPGQDSNTLDAVLILIIVLVSGIFGFIQDYEAEKTIEALQKMAAPQAKVIRDGKEIKIPSAEVVPGDLLLLESGDMIMADGWLIDTFHLEVDESVLTGESQAVRKKTNDTVYSNTFVTAGSAKMVVKQTGMDTKIGKVAASLQKMGEEKTSFQKELAHLSKNISIGIVVIGVLIAAVGYFKFGFYNSLLTAISLAVAAIPEGLPAVVVMALAFGANLMAKKNALIRKLSIIESIGAVDIICTDKTGTLTKNEMSVVRLYFNGCDTEITGCGDDIDLNETGRMLLKCGFLCNNARTEADDDGVIQYYGEQTEIALRKAAETLLQTSELKNFKRANEVSFSSKRKMMSVVVQDENDTFTVYTKGAPEVLLDKCAHIMHKGEQVTLTSEMKDTILKENSRLAQSALRVLGFAWKPTESESNDIEQDLIWIGLQGLIDPPRDEVREAVDECMSAGIRVIMITGDNPMTAGAIAEGIGLESMGTLTGPEMDKLDNQELQDSLKNGTNIFARTNPFHKLRILEALEKDHNVAMTGDGVNDALAIKKADVGISMGKKGTEVAKQASDIILLDDNFSTIKDAVKQGRTIFNNIRKFINYLLTCNFAEVAVIFLATLLFSLSDPILFPVQILWINLLTDGLVALALGVDPPAGDIMKRRPRRKGEPVIDRQLGWLIVLIGIKKTMLLLLTYFIVNELKGPESARTVLFAGFVLYEFIRIASIRYQEKLTWLSNKWLLFALFGSLLLQLLIIYTPVNQYFFVQPLGLTEWSVLLAGCAVGFILALMITSGVLKWVKEYE